MDESSKELWNWLNQYRNELVQKDPYQFFEEAIDEGIEVSSKEATRFLYQFHAQERSCPEFIQDFIIKYLCDRPCSNVIDSYTGLGEVIASIAREYKPHQEIAEQRNAKQTEVAGKLYKNLEVQWEDVAGAPQLRGAQLWTQEKNYRSIR